MRKAILIAVAVAGISGTATASDFKYEAVLSILTTKGNVDRKVITTTSGGVSRTECSLRRKAWLDEHGKGFEAVVKQMADDGKHVAFEVSCEPKGR